MTPEAFRAALETLHWPQGALGAILSCDPRLCRRWASGERSVPPVVAAWLIRLAAHHERHPVPEGWRRRAE